MTAQVTTPVISVEALSALPNANDVVRAYEGAKEDGSIVAQGVVAAIEAVAPKLNQAILDGALDTEEALGEWRDLATALEGFSNI